MEARQSFNLSAESRKVAHDKRWSWLTKYINKENKDVLYNTRVIAQEFEPQPNWTLPNIDIEKIYKMPMFHFRAANLFKFSSINIPISLSQQVYGRYRMGTCSGV